MSLPRSRTAGTAASLVRRAVLAAPLLVSLGCGSGSDGSSGTATSGDDGAFAGAGTGGGAPPANDGGGLVDLRPGATSGPVGETPPPNASGDPRSAQCGNVAGMEAIYWDWSLGIPRVDFPGDVLEPPSPFGGTFFHSAQPLVAFIYPAGWTPVEEIDATRALAAVSLVRADGAAVWRYRSYTARGFVDAVDELAAEINRLFANLGASGAFDVVCTIDVPMAQTAAGPASFGARMLRFDGFTVVIKSSVLGSAATGISVVSTYLSVSPTSEFPLLARRVFMPIERQLLFPGGGFGGDFEICDDEIDNDGDGAVDRDDPDCP